MLGRSTLRSLEAGLLGKDRILGLTLLFFVWFQLPYEKDCKNRVFCIAEIQLTTAISQ